MPTIIPHIHRSSVLVLNASTKFSGSTFTSSPQAAGPDAQVMSVNVTQPT